MTWKFISGALQSNSQHTEHSLCLGFHNGSHCAWVSARQICYQCLLLCFPYAKQNKLHKNGSIWVESNASKWKGKCGRFKSPKKCMQIVHCGFTDSALSSAPSLLPSLVLNRSTANRLQRYKAISRSIYTSISRHSPNSLSIVNMWTLFTDIFSTSKSPEILCFSIRMQSEQRRIHLACIVYTVHRTCNSSNANHGIHHFSVW